LTTVSQALQESSEILSNFSDTPNLDAQTLMAHVLGKSRAWIIAHPDDSLSPNSLHQLNTDLSIVNEGIPLPYVLGQWEFYGLKFKLTQDVLIPRPETELLVEHGIEWLQKNPHRRIVADIGTGSGCIPIAMANQLRHLFVVATDISHSALRVAAENAHSHAVKDQIHFLQADLFPSVTVHFDLICANLPYIPSKILPQMDVFGREPTLALHGGLQGLDLIRKFIYHSPHRIAPGGRILMEIESSQGQQVSSIAKSVFTESNLTVIPDLAGQDRLVIIQLPNQN
jgi:release factor glutamine methyltransferase